MCAKFCVSIFSRCDDIVAEVKGGNFMPPPPTSGWRVARRPSGCRVKGRLPGIGWTECVLSLVYIAVMLENVCCATIVDIVNYTCIFRKRLEGENLVKWLVITNNLPLPILSIINISQYDETPNRMVRESWLLIFSDYLLLNIDHKASW